VLGQNTVSSDQSPAPFSGAPDVPHTLWPERIRQLRKRASAALRPELFPEIIPQAGKGEKLSAHIDIDLDNMFITEDNSVYI
jgi:hypothetical protein